MKKTYIIPVTEMTRVETENINVLSNVKNGSTAPLEDGYAPEGVSGLSQSTIIWDDLDDSFGNNLPK